MQSSILSMQINMEDHIRFKSALIDFMKIYEFSDMNSHQDSLEILDFY